MERERKRKRAVADDSSQRRTTEEADLPPPPPSEEEVEEFFAILRRMHMAVKYFEKNNVGGIDGRELTEKLVTEILPVVEVEDDVVKGKGKVNWDLDLNRIPEGESSGV